MVVFAMCVTRNPGPAFSSRRKKWTAYTVSVSMTSDSATWMAASVFRPVSRSRRLADESERLEGARQIDARRVNRRADAEEKRAERSPERG